MPIPTLVPLLGGPPWTAGYHHPPFLPLLGAPVLVVLLLVLSAVFLAKRGRLGPAPWVAARMQGAAHNPDLTARQILAERFAKGELDSDEFLERASVLNWTPGSSYFPPQRPGKKKR